MKIDLHCHTNFSDNSFTLEEIMEQAKQNRVTHLGITDHDTTAGLERALHLGTAYNVEIIPGIEITAYDYKRNTPAHILGFYITPGHHALTELCQPFIEERHNASYQIVKRLIDKGYKITWEEVQEYAAGGTGVYKQHIMHALIKHGYTDKIYGELYRKLFFKGNRTQEPGIARVPVRYIDAVKAIQAIREAAGIPVLAHPGQYNNFEAVKDWMDEGLEGIEVWHPIHSTEDENKAKKVAEENNLVQTGGSDFHGFYGDKDIPVGTYFVNEQCLQELQKRKEKISL